MPADVAVSARTGLTALAAAVAGVGVSTYLTVEHYTAATTLACPETGAINCAKVTTSSWSMVGPIPLALLGALYFAGMLVVLSPPTWRRRDLDTLRIAGCALGVAAVLYLVWVELFRLNAICAWCTVVHVATLIMLAAVLWTTTAIRDS